jgi:hypothetical protein
MRTRGERYRAGLPLSRQIGKRQRYGLRAIQKFQKSRLRLVWPPSMRQCLLLRRRLHNSLKLQVILPPKRLRRCVRTAGSFRCASSAFYCSTVGVDVLVKWSKLQHGKNSGTSSVLLGCTTIAMQAEKELAAQKMTPQEAQKRQDAMAKNNALLFYQEQKAKRVKKIKSKAYHRHLKKQTEKSQALLATNDLDDREVALVCSRPDPAIRVSLLLECHWVGRGLAFLLH